MKKILFSLLVIFCLCSCENYLSRQWGGTIEIKLEPGEKLVEATWKKSHLWYLVEPMDSDYVPKTKVFKESSLFGICEGEVTFIESK